MNIIEKLNTVAWSTVSLSDFISSNIDDIFMFFVNQNHTNLLLHRNALDEFLCNHFKIIRKLDFTSNENKIFLDVLIDACERLNLSFYFRPLTRIKENNSFQLSIRNESTLLYINGLRSISDFSNILIPLLDKLQNAFEIEEDSNKRVIAVFFNFYANLIRNFGPIDGVRLICSSIRELKINYTFLSSEITDEILDIDINDSDETYEIIHSIIDEFLEREAIYLTYSESNFIIELETEYARKLSEINPDIYDIRRLSSQLCNCTDEVFISLGRGVSVLYDEQQLYAYIRSYGNMHFAKCNYAYERIPISFFDNNIEIIDYGCGQALASMTYLDFLNKNHHSQVVEKITLIEPSEIALKRGALHIKLFNSEIDILTINKDLNGLVPNDFNNNGNIKLHLFSNILDIDNYSTKHLANLINECFKGENIFVVVSPKITDLKTNRIDNFIYEFQLFNPEIIAHESKSPREWVSNWSIILRMLKINIT